MISDRFRSRTLASVAAALGAALVAALASASPALAQAPAWHVATEAAPTYLSPGGEGKVIASASNLGDEEINGAAKLVTIADRLPAGLTAVSVTSSAGLATRPKLTCSLAPSLVSCTYPGSLPSYERLEVVIIVKVEEPLGTETSLTNEVTVEGGGASSASGVQKLTVSGQPTPYGVQKYEFAPLNEDGSPATQAGAQPFELTTSLTLNQTATQQPVALPKDFRFRLPQGLIGNPTSVAQCTMSNFTAFIKESANLCPPDSVVGVALVTVNEPVTFKVFTEAVPVFNIVPGQGEPARLGFEIVKVPILLDTSVRSGQDYSVVASVKDASQLAGFLEGQVTFWGVPGDPRHNASRGWECIDGGRFQQAVGKTCPASSQEQEEPFLRLPTSCPSNPAAEPLTSSMETDSWAQPGSFLSTEYEWLSGSGVALGFEGCAQLPFSPGIDVSPEVHGASTPTGLKVDVKVPQASTLEAGKLAEADVRDTTVTLPEGVVLSPSAANGLEGCSEAQVGFVGFGQASQIDEFDTTPVGCPDGSKVGTVKIKTPLLSHELEGWVYLASPAPNGEGGRNPFGSLVALYIVAEDPVSGVLVKLAGEGQVDEGTLRVSTTFRNAPQVPFEDLKLELFGGPRGSLSTPALCGDYATEALFTPWSGTGPVGVLSPGEEFSISSGVGGASCPGGVPFSPGFAAGSTNDQAGAFTGFNLELARPDGDQALRGLSMHLPGGVAAMLSSVTLCTEAQANTNTCPAESEVGHATAVAGLGAEPYVQGGGRVFITGPYGGAPFGLVIVTPAVAGPFDLGFVTVRSRLFIDPNNASVTIVSDPLPTQLRGIPLQLKRVLVSVDRPNFEFNPTNCNPSRIDGTLTGDQGATFPISQPFQVANCASLPFHPSFSAATKGKNSKANGAGLTVRVGSTPGQANIGKAQVILPSTLPSRLTTIQKACVDHVFEANPASCPEGSLVGSATVHTPVLRSPLTGPAYLVSHGGAAFPDLEFVLQGEGITLILDGQTAIRKGITSSTFNSVPDAPVSSFETVLPQGPHSALTTNLPPKANYSLCATKLTMPTTLTGQNGAVITQRTKIAVEGCSGVMGKTNKKLTRAQKLSKALKACRKKFKHSKPKRQKCERVARKHYGPLKKHAKKAAHKSGTHNGGGR